MMRFIELFIFCLFAIACRTLHQFSKIFLINVGIIGLDLVVGHVPLDSGPVHSLGQFGCLVHLLCDYSLLTWVRTWSKN